ncbi:hypothetical protein Ddc_10706 [Ditylenchus destructor]|nr:hypothetical protein Ddc_10706 [Ditylenchus destructor]
MKVSLAFLALVISPVSIFGHWPPSHGPVSVDKIEFNQRVLGPFGNAILDFETVLHHENLVENHQAFLKLLRKYRIKSTSSLLGSDAVKMDASLAAPHRVPNPLASDDPELHLEKKPGSGSRKLYDLMKRLALAYFDEFLREPTEVIKDVYVVPLGNLTLGTKGLGSLEGPERKNAVLIGVLVKNHLLEHGPLKGAFSALLNLEYGE